MKKVLNKPEKKALKRPFSVRAAVAVLNVTLIFIFAIALLSIFDAQNYRAISSLEVGNGVYAVLLLIGIFCLWLLFYLVSLGWNFARYALVFLYIVDLINWLLKFYGHADVYLKVAFVLGIIELVMGLIAITLLFLPSSNVWFKRS
jgi:hypothetical protein